MSVCWLVGWSVIWLPLRAGSHALPCSNRTTCFYLSFYIYLSLRPLALNLGPQLWRRGRRGIVSNLTIDVSLVFEVNGWSGWLGLARQPSACPSTHRRGTRSRSGKTRSIGVELGGGGRGELPLLKTWPYKEKKIEKVCLGRGRGKWYQGGGNFRAGQNNSSSPDQFYFYALVAVHHILPVRLVSLPRPLYWGRVLWYLVSKIIWMMNEHELS